MEDGNWRRNGACQSSSCDFPGASPGLLQAFDCKCEILLIALCTTLTLITTPVPGRPFQPQRGSSVPSQAWPLSWLGGLGVWVARPQNLFPTVFPSWRRIPKRSQELVSTPVNETKHRGEMGGDERNVEGCVQPYMAPLPRTRPIIPGVIPSYLTQALGLYAPELALPRRFPRVKT
jgi:hypothetical protein